MCAIVGGYCAHIKALKVEDIHGSYHAYHHVWNVQAAEVMGAYHSATMASARGEGHQPFTQLTWMSVRLCSCTSPSVWHALLRLIRPARQLRCVDELSSSDPLSISALGYLPSLDTLSGESQWPASFAAFLEGRGRTRLFRFVSAPGVEAGARVEAASTRLASPTHRRT